MCWFAWWLVFPLRNSAAAVGAELIRELPWCRTWVLALLPCWRKHVSEEDKRHTYQLEKLPEPESILVVAAKRDELGLDTASKRREWRNPSEIYACFRL